MEGGSVFFEVKILKGTNGRVTRQMRVQGFRIGEVFWIGAMAAIFFVFSGFLKT